MCKLMTQHALVCDHVTTSTSRCLRASLFGIQHNPKSSTILVHDICPQCSSFWAFYGIESFDARQRYRAFRKKHKYHGPLGPMQHRHDATPMLQRERFSTEDLTIERELRSVQADLEAFGQKERRGSGDSTATQWPSFAPQEMTQVRKAASGPWSAQRPSSKIIGLFDRTRDSITQSRAPASNTPRNASDNSSIAVVVSGQETWRLSAKLSGFYMSGALDADIARHDADAVQAEHDISDAFTTISIAPVPELPAPAHTRDPVIATHLELLDDEIGSYPPTARSNFSTIADNGSVVTSTPLPMHVKRKMQREELTKIRIRRELAEGIVRLPPPLKEVEEGYREEPERLRPPQSIPLQRMLDEAARRSLPQWPRPAHLHGSPSKPNLSKSLSLIPDTEEISRSLQARAGDQRPPRRLHERLFLEARNRYSVPSSRQSSARERDAGRRSSQPEWL